MAARSPKPPRAPRGSGGAGSVRIAVLVVFLVLLFATVGGRLVWLQVWEATAYAKAAGQQRTQEITLAPRRGAILDREGQPLAVSVDAKTVYATPRTIKDPKVVAAALAKYLGGSEAAYLKKLQRKSAFAYVQRKVPLERAKPLMDAKVEGLGFADDSRRVYPCGDLACQTLGFVGIDDTGLAGLELYYNDVLGGKAGRQIAERDAFGNPIPGGIKVAEEPVDGKDIVLTLDKDIQYQTQLSLAATVKKYGAKSGSVVIMNPRDGEIYAVASTPTYDPNEYQKATSAAVRAKPIVDTYEPGSTVKAFTASAVIERGIFKPSSEFVLPPTINVGGRTIHEAHDRGTVTWDLTQIVTQSSNVGAVKLGQALGPSKLSASFAAFGLLERTGVDFPGEGKGWMPPVDAWSASTIGNVPFGQGVSVTALQLARALGGIANRGELVTPHFLSGVRGDPSVKVAVTPERAVSPRTALTMTDVLSQVVKDGTGKPAAVDGYHVAGKTGTAQKPIEGGRGYAEGAYVASFAGFVPAEDPKVLIIVTVDEPQGAIYGGSVAAPLFSELAGYALGHLKIPPPDRAAAPAGGTRRARRAAEVSAAAYAARKARRQKAAAAASGKAGKTAVPTDADGSGNAPATGSEGSGSP